MRFPEGLNLLRIKVRERRVRERMARCADRALNEGGSFVTRYFPPGQPRGVIFRVTGNNFEAEQAEDEKFFNRLPNGTPVTFTVLDKHRREVVTIKGRKKR